MVECVSRTWRHWLIGRSFVVRTDHAPLRQLLTKKGEDFTARQLRWYEKLEPYSFTVEYVRGEDNVVADALSRQPVGQMAAIVLGNGDVHRLTRKLLIDAATQDSLYQEVITDQMTCEQLELCVDEERQLLYRRDGTLWVPNDDLLRFQLMLESHEPLFAGHFGCAKTLAQARRWWWWPQMQQWAEEVVMNCDACQRNGTKKKRDEGPLERD